MNNIDLRTSGAEVPGLPARRAGSPDPALSLSNKIDSSNGQLFRRSWHWQNKTRLLLRNEIWSLARTYGLDRLVFFTVTSPDNCVDKAEWEKRVNRLMTGKVRLMCHGRFISVRQRQRRGAWHLHSICVADGDVRTGTRWNHIGRVAWANPELLKWWKMCADLRNKYNGIGRISAEPIKGSVERAANYLSAYVTKDDIGVELKKRIVTYGKGFVRSTCSRVMLLTERSSMWRVRLKAVARRVMDKFPYFDEARLHSVVYEIFRDVFKGAELREEFERWSQSLIRREDIEGTYFRSPDVEWMDGRLWVRVRPQAPPGLVA